MCGLSSVWRRRPLGTFTSESSLMLPYSSPSEGYRATRAKPSSESRLPETSNGNLLPCVAARRPTVEMSALSPAPAPRGHFPVPRTVPLSLNAHHHHGSRPGGCQILPRLTWYLQKSTQQLPLSTTCSFLSIVCTLSSTEQTSFSLPMTFLKSRREELAAWPGWSYVPQTHL